MPIFSAAIWCVGSSRICERVHARSGHPVPGVAARFVGLPGSCHTGDVGARWPVGLLPTHSGGGSYSREVHRFGHAWLRGAAGREPIPAAADARRLFPVGPLSPTTRGSAGPCRLACQRAKLPAKRGSSAEGSTRLWGLPGCSRQRSLPATSGDLKTVVPPVPSKERRHSVFCICVSVTGST
jgi:hypothetical protein